MTKQQWMRSTKGANIKRQRSESLSVSPSLLEQEDGCGSSFLPHIPYAQFLLNDISENSLRCHLKGDPSLVSSGCRSTAETQDTDSRQPWHTLHTAESKLCKRLPTCPFLLLHGFTRLQPPSNPHTKGGIGCRALHRQ